MLQELFGNLGYLTYPMMEMMDDARRGAEYKNEKETQKDGIRFDPIKGKWVYADGDHKGQEASKEDIDNYWAKNKEGDEALKFYLQVINCLADKLKPVAITFEINLTIEGFGSSSLSPIGIGVILRGKNPGQVFAFSTGGIGGGWVSASASIVKTTYFYTGDIANFSKYSLRVKSLNYVISGGVESWSLGRGISYAEDYFGSYIIGVSVSAGSGGSPTIFSTHIIPVETNVY